MPALLNLQRAVRRGGLTGWVLPVDTLDRVGHRGQQNPCAGVSGTVQTAYGWAGLDTLLHMLEQGGVRVVTRVPSIDTALPGGWQLLRNEVGGVVERSLHAAHRTSTHCGSSQRGTAPEQRFSDQQLWLAEPPLPDEAAYAFQHGGANPLRIRTTGSRRMGSDLEIATLTHLAELHNMQRFRNGPGGEKCERGRRKLVPPLADVMERAGVEGYVPRTWRAAYDRYWKLVRKARHAAEGEDEKKDSADEDEVENGDEDEVDDIDDEL